MAATQWPPTQRNWEIEEMNMDLVKFCDKLDDELFNTAARHGLDLRFDVRATGKNMDTVTSYINDGGEKNYKLVFRNGVVAVYNNDVLQDCYFECDHVLTDDTAITAAFYLSLCDQMPATEYLPIE